MFNYSLIMIPECQKHRAVFTVIEGIVRCPRLQPVANTGAVRTRQVLIDNIKPIQVIGH